MKTTKGFLCSALFLAVLGLGPLSANDVAEAAPGEASPIGRALAELRERSGKGPAGNHEESGVAGRNLADVYREQVMDAVRPNWGFASAEGRNLSCVVEVKVDMQGRVREVGLARSSGEPQFDASAVMAVTLTAQQRELPPPPSEELCDLDLVFSIDAAADASAVQGGPESRKEEGLPATNEEWLRFMAEWEEKERRDRARWQEEDRRMKAEMEEEDRRRAAALAEQERRWAAEREETERRRAAEKEEEERRLAAEAEEKKRRAEEKKRARAELDRTLQESGRLHPVGPKIFGFQLGTLYTSARKDAEEVCKKRERILQQINPCMDLSAFTSLLLPGNDVEVYGTMSDDIFVAGTAGILEVYSLPLSIFNYDQNMDKNIFIKKFEENYDLALECKKESDECKYRDNKSGFEVTINFKKDILTVNRIVKESELIFK